jgi:hypothetical protein
MSDNINAGIAFLAGKALADNMGAGIPSALDIANKHSDEPLAKPIKPKNILGSVALMGKF